MGKEVSIAPPFRELFFIIKLQRTCICQNTLQIIQTTPVSSQKSLKYATVHENVGPNQTFLLVRSDLFLNEFNLFKFLETCSAFNEGSQISTLDIQIKAVIVKLLPLWLEILVHILTDLVRRVASQKPLGVACFYQIISQLPIGILLKIHPPAVLQKLLCTGQSPIKKKKKNFLQQSL